MTLAAAGCLPLNITIRCIKAVTEADAFEDSCCLGFFSVADTPVIPPKVDLLADYNFTKVPLSSAAFHNLQSFN